MARQRRCPGLGLPWGSRCDQGSLLGGGDIALRTGGWIGVHHGSESREEHVEGCTKTVVIGYLKGQSLEWEGTLTLFLLAPLDRDSVAFDLRQEEQLSFWNGFLKFQGWTRWWESIEAEEVTQDAEGRKHIGWWGNCVAGTERKKGWEKEGVKKERRELNIHTFLIHWHQLLYTLLFSLNPSLSPDCWALTEFPLRSHTPQGWLPQSCLAEALLYGVWAVSNVCPYEEHCCEHLCTITPPTLWACFLGDNYRIKDINSFSTHYSQSASEFQKHTEPIYKPAEYPCIHGLPAPAIAHSPRIPHFISFPGEVSL